MSTLLALGLLGAFAGLISYLYIKASEWLDEQGEDA